jgi:chromate transporter
MPDEPVPDDTPAAAAPHEVIVPGRLGELAVLFLRLGATAFGGPAAHIALVEAEVVRRRGWVTPERFLEMLALANLLPGPNSTELVLLVGRERAGLPGMLVAGFAFILPAVVVVAAITGAYLNTRALPAVDDVLAGVVPVVLAIVVQSIFALSRTALRAPIHALAFFATLGFAFVPRVHPLGLLVAAGGFVAAHVAAQDRRRCADAGLALGAGMIALVAAIAPTFLVPPAAAPAPGLAAAPTPATPAGLFLAFLKIGSVLFGSGHVLVAWLEEEFVTHRGWLDEKTLLDAVAVGQVTPGPLFTTATFVGGVVAGSAGALAATVGIFLPAFVFVAASARIDRFVARRPSTRAFVEGVGAASLGLLGHAAIVLAGTALRWPWTFACALAAFVILVRQRVAPLWLMGAGALAGLAWGWARG